MPIVIQFVLWLNILLVQCLFVKNICNKLLEHRISVKFTMKLEKISLRFNFIR